MKLKLYYGQRQASFIQDYQVLQRIASAVFGGSKSKEPEVSEIPQTGDDLKRMFGSVFGHGGQ